MSTGSTHIRRSARTSRTGAVLIAGALVASVGLVAESTATAVPPAPGVVFDDFEDNDVSDWGYFGGNNAGGGLRRPGTA